MESEALKRLIEDGFADAEVRVSGDGRHFDAIVISDAFSGKSMLEQHRMVYAVLGDRFDTDAVHALSIKTYTPEDWESIRA